MKRKFNVSYVVIPILYAVLIFSLLILQFTGGKLFNSSLGPISLTGTFAMGGGNANKQIASLRIQVQGIQFAFDKDHPIVLQNQDGSQLPIAMTGYSTKENGYTLDFQHDVQLDFHFTDAEQKAASIDVNIPAGLLPLQSLSLPYAPASDASITVSQGAPGMDISWRGSKYQLALPTRSYTNEQKQLLVIPGDSSKSLRIAQRNTSDQSALQDFQVPSVTPKEFQAGVDAFVGAAYNGWRTTRFNSSSNTWSYRDGDSRFSEEILVDLLSEAWQRDEYTRAFNDMRTAADNFPARISYRSSVFLGNLRRVTNDLSDADRRESARIDGLVAQKSLDVFQTPGLFQFALDRGSGGLSSSLVQFAESLPLEGIDPVQALGILQNVYLTDLPDPKLDASLSRFSALIKSTVLPAVAHVDEGFFFQTKPGKGDGYYTVLAGRILEKAGAKLGDDRLVALGRNMVLSVLKLADDQGFIPNQIDFAAGAISAMLKYRGPEDIYWMVQSNPSYPKAVSLYPQLGPGHWLYTIAQVNSISIKPTEFRFNISYPRSRTHYLFFRGLNKIDPLAGMQLFGITWRNAPDFEVYSKGRYYNPDTQTLMVKYFDDSVQKDIVIWYE